MPWNFMFISKILICEELWIVILFHLSILHLFRNATAVWPKQRRACLKLLNAIFFSSEILSLSSPCSHGFSSPIKHLPVNTSFIFAWPGHLPSSLLYTNKTLLRMWATSFTQSVDKPKEHDSDCKITYLFGVHMLQSCF